MIVQSANSFLLQNKIIPMTSGEHGFCAPHNKQEGDRKTPIIPLKPLALYYRADRVPVLKTCLPTYVIKQNDGWCDAPNDKNYNQFVTLPYPASCETLYRDDHKYDYFLVTDYNYPNAIANKGSAIFIHIMNPDKTPTAGCLAFHRFDLVALIESLNPNDTIAFVDGLTKHVDQ